jgi:hypothetical protein
MEAVERLMFAMRRLVALFATLCGLSLAAIWTSGCEMGPTQREVSLRATVETLNDQLVRLQASALDPARATTTPAVATPSAAGAMGIKTSASREWWVANHRATSLWSSATGGRVLASVPQWSFLVVMEPQDLTRIHVYMPGGQRSGYVGDGWAEAADLGPVDGPAAGAVDLATVPKARPVVEPTATPRPTSGTGLDFRLLDWKTVNDTTTVGDLELTLNAVLLGQESYGGPYGTKVTAGRGMKIVLADAALRYAFKPGTTPTEIHVDFFVIGDSGGLEYRGLTVPMTNAMPDRFFLSPGQAFRGIVGFIVPQEMKSGRLYFTNFLGTGTPPERLTVYVRDLP